MDGFEAAAAALHALADDIQAYLANPPREHLFVAPIVDWHHDDYAQASVVGLSKLLTQVVKERQIMDSVSILLLGQVGVDLFACLLVC
jgi:hypothetical protein